MEILLIVFCGLAAIGDSLFTDAMSSRIGNQFLSTRDGDAGVTEGPVKFLSRSPSDDNTASLPREPSASRSWTNFWPMA